LDAVAPAQLKLAIEAVEISLNEALHREWRLLADEIAEDDPEESHLDLQQICAPCVFT
jgi:hypothetical protein